MISRYEYEYWEGIKFDVEVESSAYVPETYHSPAEGGDFTVLGVYLPSGEEITDSLKESVIKYIERQLRAEIEKEAREDGPTTYDYEPIERLW